MGLAVWTEEMCVNGSRDLKKAVQGSKISPDKEGLQVNTLEKQQVVNDLILAEKRRTVEEFH